MYIRMYICAGYQRSIGELFAVGARSASNMLPSEVTLTLMRREDMGVPGFMSPDGAGLSLCMYVFVYVYMSMKVSVCVCKCLQYVYMYI